MLRFFQVNRDIFLRTLCLVIVTLFFHFCRSGTRRNSIGRQYFANAIIHSIFLYHGWFCLFRRSVSGGNMLVPIINRHYIARFASSSFGVSAFLQVSPCFYFFGGKSFLGLLTNEISVIREAENYFYWVLAIPLTGFAAFLWDGIFIGATATRQMFYSMLVASGSFFLVYYSLHEWMGKSCPLARLHRLFISPWHHAGSFK